MAEIGGGGLHFDASLDNEKMNAAIEETMRRIQGLSDGTVAGGKKMDAAFYSTAEEIRNALSQIGAACELHEAELQKLEAEYRRLGQQAAIAFNAGRDEEYNAITKQQAAIKGEIVVREKELQTLREQSNALENLAQKQEENANTQVSMRTRIRELREEMMRLVDQGIDEQSEAYQRLKNELGRLTDIQMDVQQQGRTLANDEAQFQGIISGLSGLAGGFSAVTGAVSLFAGENDDLQKVMTKVQSVMAITIGLQQVSQTLNKDSAFQLVTLNGLKEWWRKIVEKATVAETAETVATTANTAAKQANAAATGESAAAETLDTAGKAANTVAATTGTAANLTLAGAFRAVGLAIKSIPVFGWIITGVAALATAVGLLTKKQREAKKAQEEFSEAIIEGAYKPIGTIEMLSAKWTALGDNLDAKKRFIDENRKAFDELGASVNDVADAENLLVKNKDAFIDAQIAKAKASIYLQQSMEKVKKQMELEQEISKMSDTKTVAASYGMFGIGYSYETENTVKTKKKKELEDLKEEIKRGYENAAAEELKGFDILKNIDIKESDEYEKFTVGWYEKMISEKQAYIKKLSDPKAIQEANKQITDWQKQLERLTGAKSAESKTTGKDPFLEKLEKYKSEYARFYKWINSGDEAIVRAANKEFDGLLKEGETYIDYLKRQRDIILSVDIESRTKEQNAQLRMLNDQIAEETKKTVLEAFNTELSDQLNNANNVIEMLNIIEKRRKELANDGTEIDTAKGESLDEAEKTAKEQLKKETEQLLEDYASYIDRKIKLETDYNNDLALLEKRRLEATSDAEREQAERAIANRKKRYEQESKGTGDVEYDEMLNAYGTFEQKKQEIIDEYDEKRRIAQEHNNEELISKLNEAQAKAISALASEELTGTEAWTNLFGNLDELTAQQITVLINEIESKFEDLSGVFDPIDLNAIRDKLNEARRILIADNPFKQVGESLKAIFDDAGEDSKDSAQKIKQNWKQLAEATEGSFDFIFNAIDSADFLKDAIGEVGETAISSLSTVASVAIATATAIKTAEKASVVLAIIQAALAAVQAVANVVSSIFGSKDRKIEKSIQKHAEAVGRLQAAYAQLSWEIDKALGSDVYKQQQAAIANMEDQRKQLKAMWEAEEKKKKTDSDKVNEYKDQYDQLGRDIQDMLDEISADILQTDAKSFADELGDALVNAFSKGEDAAGAFGDTVDNIIKQAVLNQLKKNFLETQLQGALDSLEKSMGYWEGDKFVFDTLTDAEIAAFKAQVSTITNGFNNALGQYEKIFQDIETPEADVSLTGAVKGVTEETASILAGQMNAMRINQIEATDILRQQLMNLSVIAQNTSYNVHLTKLDRIVTLLEAQSSNSLRSQGLS